MIGPAIEAERLTFRYEGQEEPVFRDMTFSVRQGETVLFLGPSGCGKSTLLYCLNRLYPESVDGSLDGAVRIYGRNLSEFAPGEACRRIGTVFQDPDSQFCMTRVDEEIAFGLENLGIPRRDMDERIIGALEQAGLLDYRNEKIHTLSGGMKQRLAVACALAADPSILILDEPTAQLDPAAARDLVRWIGRLRRERGLTLLLVEHRLDEWIGLVDRTLVMDADGRLSREGTPRAIFSADGASLTAQGIWMPTVSKLAFDFRSSGAHSNGELPVTEEQFIEGVGQLPDTIALLEERLRSPSPAERPAASGGSTLCASGLTVRMGRKTVLHSIDLAFRPGELTAIVGTNGSGKTTLLQHMAGIGGGSVPSGRCLLDGRPLSDWPQHELRRHIGYVFQNPEHQFVTFTVRDELAFGPRLQGVPEKIVDVEVSKLLQLSGLAGWEEANPFSLSQGQKRRLSVATMLLDEQRWLLLDEPTFGQDARTSEQLMTLLRDRANAGMSVIMVSHDMEAVQQYAHRVILLVDGRVRYDGVPARLWSQPGLLASGGILPPVSYRLLTRLTAQLERGDTGAALRTVESGR